MEQNSQRPPTATVCVCCSSFPLSTSIKLLGPREVLNSSATTQIPLPSSCALEMSDSCMCEDVSLIKGLQMGLTDVANRSVICQSFGTNTRSALCQQILRSSLASSCSPARGRDSGGLLAHVPLQAVSGVDFMSHCTIVCCPNHTSVGPEEELLTHNSAWPS